MPDSLNNPPVPLFEFALWPPDSVTAWHDHLGRRFLSWYGLTSGWYTMRCAGVEVLRYNQKMIDATRDKRGWDFRTPYFDYQVAAFYDCLLEVLPRAIDPVPPDVLNRIRTPDAQRAFEDACNLWIDTRIEQSPPADHDRLTDRWAEACEWLRSRRLQSGHMAGQPDIHFWSEGDLVTIRWSDDPHVEPESGLLWNDVAPGEASMPRSVFLKEVQNFHDRLMAAMAERIEVVRAGWPQPGVAIDLPALEAEHADQRHLLSRSLQETQHTDWNAVREAIAEVVGP